MELNWTTFILEILNFLVLVWLLKHLFYKPVKEMIAHRRQAVEGQLQEARAMEAQAEKLRAQYEGRLTDWERERQAARKQLAGEIEEERRRLLAELREELAAERKRNEVLEERKASEQLRHSEMRGLDLGARFAARLLQEFGSAELEMRLTEMLLTEVRQLPPERIQALAAESRGGKAETVQVLSAYPLDVERRQNLQHALDSLFSRSLAYDFHEDRELIAGLRITIGSWVIHANLRDELRSFAAIAHER